MKIERRRIIAHLDGLPPYRDASRQAKVKLNIIVVLVGISLLIF
jgi:hypothetical protein